MTRNDNVFIIRKLLKPLGLSITIWHAYSIYKIVDDKGMTVDIIRNDYAKTIHQPLIDREFMLDFISSKVVKFVRYNGNVIINPYLGCKSHEELFIVYDMVSNG